MGKMTKTPFSGTMERATDLLEIIHTDVCDPISVEARGGYTISDRGVYKVHVNTWHCACVYTINELAPKLV